MNAPATPAHLAIAPRPVPDALVPPNGCRRSRTFCEFTKHIPASMDAATRCALPMFSVHT